MSLEETDKAAAAVAVAPRVSLADIENAIAHTFYANGDDVIHDYYEPSMDTIEQLKVLTVCLVIMKNGFIVVGKSAPASPENFNALLGQKFAYEDAVRQLWPLMGFSLRDKLASE